MGNPLSNIKIITLCSVLALTACDENMTLSDLGRKLDPIPGTEKAKATSTRRAPDSRGVITYPNYQVIVAGRNETVGDIASRVGLTAQELADYNGLSKTYRPRSGEVLALPPSVARSGDPVDLTSPTTDTNTSRVDIEGIATTALEDSDDAARTATDTAPAPTGAEPIRHRVEPGETAYSIARLYGVSVTALASWNGLGRDLAVRDGQQLLIPVTTDGKVKAEASASTTSAAKPVKVAAAAAAVPLATPKPKPAPTVSKPGKGSETPKPPSAAKPLPANTQTAAANDIAPDLSQNLTPAGASRKLLQPVNGNIVRGYKKGAGGNDGIDIAASEGTGVKAAEDGEVALISKGADGKAILLIRHPDNLYTVYSNIKEVSLKKGQKVSRGQKVGAVASGSPAYMHFEIRRGTESVDPAPYL